MQKKASLIIGADGVLRGNIAQINTVLVEGKLIGDIAFVDRVKITRTATVYGNISCKSLEVCADAVLVGSLHVSPDLSLESFTQSNGGEGAAGGAAGGVDRQIVGRSPEKTRKSNNHGEGGAEEETDGKVVLLLVCPQWDFVGSASCAVPNAKEDSETLAEMISQSLDSNSGKKSGFDDIIVCLATHQVNLLNIKTTASTVWQTSSPLLPPFFFICLFLFEKKK